MKITFDPKDPEDIAAIMALMQVYAGGDHDAAMPVMVNRNITTNPEDRQDPGTDAEGAVDANGTPWIPAIHSANKTKTDKGVWRRQRGVDKAEADKIEAAARLGTPAPAPAPAQAPQIPGMPPAPQMPQFPGMPPAQMQFPGMPMATVPAVSWDDLVAKVTAFQTAHPTYDIGPIWANALEDAGISDNTELMADTAAGARVKVMERLNYMLK